MRRHPAKRDLRLLACMIAPAPAVNKHSPLLVGSTEQLILHTSSRFVHGDPVLFGILLLAIEQLPNYPCLGRPPVRLREKVYRKHGTHPN